jgi:hypothetical protein
MSLFESQGDVPYRCLDRSRADAAGGGEECQQGRPQERRTVFRFSLRVGGNSGGVALSDGSATKPGPVARTYWRQRGPVFSDRTQMLALLSLDPQRRSAPSGRPVIGVIVVGRSEIKRR